MTDDESAGTPGDPRSTNREVYVPPPGSTAERVLDRRDEILSRWLEAVKRTIRAAAGEREPIIVDTLPAFVENIAQALDPTHPRTVATENTSVATEHGGERARVTQYQPDEVIREFQILREIVIEVLSEDQPLTQQELQVIVRSIDQAMAESLMAFFLVQESLRQQFTATLTHDLRNPLTAIQATTDLLLRHPDRVARVPILAARIAENVRRIDRMIQDLLDATRVRFGQQLHFEVGPCELRALVRDVLEQLATVYGDRFTLTGEPIEGFWNADAFKRAIENLVINAIKYGDATTPIAVRLEDVHGRAIVSVHNHGPTIPVEEQERLFQSFVRARAPQKGRTGWGLGLAMVRGMAEGHGGSITVDSTPERGTTFVIDVPVDARAHVRHPLTPGA